MDWQLTAPEIIAVALQIFQFVEKCAALFSNVLLEKTMKKILMTAGKV